jgi:hypothetical protein
VEDRIRNAIARVEVFHREVLRNYGTAFLVTDSLVLTALHVVADRTDPPRFFEGEIHLEFPKQRVSAVVEKQFCDRLADWVVLRCLEPPRIAPLPLRHLHASGVAWESFGFPEANSRDGMVVTGTVENHNAKLEGTLTFQLYSRQAAAGSGMPIKGLSGAPVLVGDAAVGLLRYALLEENKVVAGTVYACPVGFAVEGCTEIPAPRGLTLRERPQSTLLKQLRLNFVGRRKQITDIESIVADANNSSHILIQAPAGYGKSALVAFLVELHPDYLYHFVREEDQHHTATALLESLCLQLSGQIGEPRSYAGVGLSTLEEGGILSPAIPCSRSAAARPKTSHRHRWFR